MSAPNSKGYVTSTKFTFGEINGIRTRIKNATLRTGVTNEVVGFIRAVKEGEAMIVVIEGMDGSGNIKNVPMITTEMLDAAVIRDGILCFD